MKACWSCQTSGRRFEWGWPVSVNNDDCMQVRGRWALLAARGTRNIVYILG